MLLAPLCSTVLAWCLFCCATDRQGHTHRTLPSASIPGAEERVQLPAASEESDWGWGRWIIRVSQKYTSFSKCRRCVYVSRDWVIVPLLICQCARWGEVVAKPHTQSTLLLVVVSVWLIGCNNMCLRCCCCCCYLLMMQSGRQLCRFLSLSPSLHWDPESSISVSGLFPSGLLAGSGQTYQ